MAHNQLKETVRGMHFQVSPAAETKLARCPRGAVLDIIVDFRPESPTYLQHIEVDLNEGQPARDLRARAVCPRLPRAARQPRHELPGAQPADREEGLLRATGQGSGLAGDRPRQPGSQPSRCAPSRDPPCRACWFAHARSPSIVS